MKVLAHLPSLPRKLLYFGLQGAIGSHIGAAWRELDRWQRMDRHAIDHHTDRLLEHLLGHALSSVEYFRAFGLRRLRDPRELLHAFPILRRADIRAHFAELVSDDHRSKIRSPDSAARHRYDWTVVKTGGTTGEPTSVVHDAQCRDWGRATRLLSQASCGFPLGTGYFRLWGSEADLLAQSESLRRRVLASLLGEVQMNAFRGQRQDLERHLRFMKARPDIHHMMAYVDAAVSLAEFVEREGLAAPKLDTIMACAGNVTPYAREILTRVFGAAVFDKYGSRECADIACECSAHTGLHIYSPHVFLEVVDDDGRPCRPGVSGRILVTMLRNTTFPMIRYEIGDLGTLADGDPCACGSPFPRLASLEGRLDDRLTASDGTLVSSAFVRHFVGVAMNRQLVQEWQFEQTGAHAFVFRYIPLADRGLADNLESLGRALRRVLGERAAIEMVRVPEIPRSPTGKTRWIINRYQPRASAAP